jgi:broad-specificity NMP kinase
MKVRENVSREVLSQIEEEKRERAHRLRMLPMTYSSERMFLSKAVESLEREKRQEIVRLSRDISGFSREVREKLEEYEGMEQLFSALSVTKKSQQDRNVGPDART